MSFRRDEAGGSGGPKHKREAAANRDALFGPPPSSSGSSKKPSNTPRTTTASRSSAASTPSPSSNVTASLKAGSSSNSQTAQTTTSSTNAQGYSYTYQPSSNKPSLLSTSVLSGAAKVSKMQEAEDYRKKATKAMQSGLFTKPEPVAAATYYKRAADAYQQCGENRLERLHRIASADCSRGTGTFATAAAEYTRAAQLAQVSTEETPERKQQEGNKLYNDAAQAWREIGETAKAAKCQVQAALALLWERDVTLLPKDVLSAMEQAIEAHVPDVLNRYGRYRQTGTSAFLSANETIDKPSPQTLALAKDQMVTQTYAQEGIQDLLPVLIHFGEYASALYAAGAISAILERDGVSTLSLSRAYVVETILTLALGDAVAAEQAFLQTHVQSTFYLSSRECQLAEELFRAILQRDVDALDEARSPSGRNRAALANLPHETMRLLVAQLRVSGVAKRINTITTGTTTTTTTTTTRAAAAKIPPPPPATSTTTTKPFAAPPVVAKPELATKSRSQVTPPTASTTSTAEDHDELDGDALQAEMDNLMDELGIDENSDGGGEDIDDDDIDLR